MDYFKTPIFIKLLWVTGCLFLSVTIASCFRTSLAPWGDLPCKGCCETRKHGDLVIIAKVIDDTCEGSTRYPSTEVTTVSTDQTAFTTDIVTTTTVPEPTITTTEPEPTISTTEPEPTTATSDPFSSITPIVSKSSIFTRTLSGSPNTREPTTTNMPETTNSTSTVFVSTTPTAPECEPPKVVTGSIIVLAEIADDECQSPTSKLQTPPSLLF